MGPLLGGFCCVGAVFSFSVSLAMSTSSFSCSITLYGCSSSSRSMITDGFWSGRAALGLSLSRRSLALVCSELAGKLTDTMILSPDVNTDLSAGLASLFEPLLLALECLDPDRDLFAELDLPLVLVLGDLLLDLEIFLFLFLAFDLSFLFDVDLDLDLCFLLSFGFAFFLLGLLLLERELDNFLFLLFLDLLLDRIFFLILSATGNFFLITIFFLFAFDSLPFFCLDLEFLDRDLDLELELEELELELDELELRLREDEEDVDFFLPLLVVFLPRDLERLRLTFLFLVFFSFFVTSRPNSSLLVSASSFLPGPASEDLDFLSLF